ncbi:MAG: GTP-binding protein [bacterium]|nr:GTP-binding protein [bacterium]
MPIPKKKPKIIKELEKQLGVELEDTHYTVAVDGPERVTVLNLSHCNLTDISPLSRLHALRHLYLHNNQLTDISPLSGLHALTILKLNNNQLTDISPLSGLHALRNLYLHNNHLTDISPLSQLNKLTHLNLRKNKLTTLPPDVVRWGIPFMALDGNPLESPPIEIAKKGISAINAWFDSFRDAQSKPLNEAKILLVGDGGAGKTSLVKQLLHQGFDPQEDKTDGIFIRPWRLPSNDQIKINIWDFGGQEIYHATHQFFLTKRSLYIVVLDARKEEKAEYWLKHVNSFGGDSPVLVVLNKIDNHNDDLDRRHLQAKYPNIKGFFPLSCKTGTGIPEFTATLSALMEKVELIHTNWAMPWFRVKEQLENMRTIMKKPYIDKTDYDALCAAEKIDTGTEGQVLVEYLNDLGVVVHHKDFKLRETHVLDPEWVTAGVYKVINNHAVREAGGVLELSDLDGLLGAECENGYCYPAEARRFLMELMVKYQLCFEVAEERMLFPGLLPKQQPAFQWEERDELRFRFQYEFLPPSVLPRFMVRMHKDIYNNLRWRTGVVLRDEAFGCTAFVKADMDDKRIVVRVQGRHKRDYFSALLFELRRINGSFEKLDVQELVSMPDTPGITVPYDHLLFLESQRVAEYIPHGARKAYNVKELLGSVKVPVEKENLEEIKKILEKIADAQDTEESLAQKLDAVLESKANEKEESGAQKFNKIVTIKPKILGVEVDVNEWFKQILAKQKKKKKKKE